MREQPETLGKRIGRFVAVLGIVFVITFAVVLSQRLSDEVLGNIAMIGIVGTLFVAVIVLLIYILLLQNKRVRQLEQQQEQRHNSPYHGQAPPVIVVTPGMGQLPYGQPYGQQPPPQFAAPTERSFQIVGEES